MSAPLIARSADLRRLADEGYELQIRDSYLLVDHVPYVTPEKEVAYGTLVSTLTLAGDTTATPDTHVMNFIGEVPCNEHGEPLSKIINSSQRVELSAEITIDHIFSSKPPATPAAPAGYPDYYEKVCAYVALLAGPAQKLDPTATVQTFKTAVDADGDSPFAYMETASARVGIVQATEKLKLAKVAIVGLGGTGSYVLDLLAKTPIAEIHLYDGDRFLQHNAFRAPGAPSIAVLRKAPNKTAYFKAIYSNMHLGVIAHQSHVFAGNVEELVGMEYVFLCLDDGPARKLIVDALERAGVPFIDVGMGVFETNGTLGGLVRVTASTPTQRQHVHDRQRISFGAADEDNDYRHNVQIADLNMLNATYAVIKFKKLIGFYFDLEGEHNSVYEIDGNSIINDDPADGQS